MFFSLTCAPRKIPQFFSSKAYGYTERRRHNIELIRDTRTDKTVSAVSGRAQSRDQYPQEPTSISNALLFRRR